MSENIKVNSADAEERASKIESAAAGFEGIALAGLDGLSTISANRSSKDAFSLSQQNVNMFGQTLAQDVENIRSLGLSFDEFDEMAGRMNQNK